jgi:hypothetical protein
VVSDTQGRILAHPDARRVMTRMDKDPQLAGAWSGWQLLRSPLEPSGVSVELPGLITSVAAVNGPDWLLWRLQPEDRLLRPLHAARSRALADALVMVLVASLVLLVLVGRSAVRSRCSMPGSTCTRAGPPAAARSGAWRRCCARSAASAPRWRRPMPSCWEGWSR